MNRWRDVLHIYVWVSTIQVVTDLSDKSASENYVIAHKLDMYPVVMMRTSLYS